MLILIPDLSFSLPHHRILIVLELMGLAMRLELRVHVGIDVQVSINYDQVSLRHSLGVFNHKLSQLLEPGVSGIESADELLVCVFVQTGLVVGVNDMDELVSSHLDLGIQHALVA
jgi:hypothetical protein